MKQVIWTAKEKQIVAAIISSVVLKWAYGNELPEDVEQEYKSSVEHAGRTPNRMLEVRQGPFVVTLEHKPTN